MPEIRTTTVITYTQAEVESILIEAARRDNGTLEPIDLKRCHAEVLIIEDDNRNQITGGAVVTLPAATD